MQLGAAAVHREAQQRAAVLQPADRQRPRFLAHRDEVAAELLAVSAHVPRERLRPGRGLHAGLAAVDQEQPRVGGHLLPERGGGEVRAGRDLRLDRPVGYDERRFISGRDRGQAAVWRWRGGRGEALLEFFRAAVGIFVVRKRNDTFSFVETIRN